VLLSCLFCLLSTESVCTVLNFEHLFITLARLYISWFFTLAASRERGGVIAAICVMLMSRMKTIKFSSTAHTIRWLLFVGSKRYFHRQDQENNELHISLHEQASIMSQRTGRSIRDHSKANPLLCWIVFHLGGLSWSEG